MVNVQIRYFAAFLLVACTGAHASESASGTFTADKVCEAYTSFSKKTDPDGLKTTVGGAYPIFEVNRPGEYSWVRVLVNEGPQPGPRWISADCGAVSDFKVKTAVAPIARPPVPNICQTPDLYDSFVLASTWQAGFCNFKVAGKVDSKPECVALATGELKPSNLTLHGLWPNKKECGINYGHCGGQPLDLKPQTRKEIETWMPNFIFSTSFGSYEWNKHGTCQTALDDDAYFLKAVSAVKALNGSKLGALVLASMGKKLSKADLVNAIKADDPKAVGSVAFLCSKDSLYEIRVNLPVDFKTDAGLSGLVGSNPQPLGNQEDVCPDEGIHIAIGGKYPG